LRYDHKQGALLVLIDDLIGYISPKAGMKRLAYRQATELKKRKYEGAAKTKRTASWHTNSTSANNENQGSIPILRDRARDLCRNNPYANRAKGLIATNIVGSGIMPNLGEGAFGEKWKEWSETTACDYDGQLTFAGIQKMVTEATVESGEILVKRILVPNDPVFPLKLQLIESDMLPMDRVSLTKNNNNRIVQGIELNSKNQRVAYHLYDTHPGGVAEELIKSTFSTKRIPERDIAHIFRQDRPGQFRGVTWYHAVMIILKELDEYQDAQLVRQKIASMFAGFVKDYEDNGLGDHDDAEDSDDFCNLSPGTIEELAPGKDIVFSNPPGVHDSYRDYISSVLHGIAAGLGVSYESLTGDLSEINFSSARMGWLEMHRNFECWRQTVINPKLNSKVYKWFSDVALSQGLSQGFEKRVTWTSPKRDMIDPTKEVPAKIKAIRAGLISPSDAIREQGKNPDDHFAQVAKDFEKMDTLGLVLDSDPRKVNSAGSAQIEGDDSEKRNDTEAS